MADRDRLIELLEDSMFKELTHERLADHLLANGVINRQKAEIERLQELLTEWKTEAYKVADEKDELYCNAVERVKTAKAEAIKEFAERLKKEFDRYGATEDCHCVIDNLVKEMGVMCDD